MGNYQTAIEYYNRIGRKSKKFKETLLEIAWCFYKQNNFELAKDLLNGFVSTDNDDRNALESKILQAKMYADTKEYENALTEYEKVDENYKEIRRQIEDLVENNKDVFDILNLFAQMVERDYFNRRVRLLNQWTEIHDFTKLSGLVQMYRRVEKLRKHIFQTHDMMGKVKSQLFVNRDFFKKINKTKGHSETFISYGKKLYELIQPFGEHEARIICIYSRIEECDEIRKVVNTREKYYVEKIRTLSKDEKEPFVYFRKMVDLIGIEEITFQKYREKYDINIKFIKQLDRFKNKFSSVNSEFLQMQNWIQTILMDKYANFGKRKRQLKKLTRDSDILGRRLALAIYNEIKKIYGNIVSRLNAYKFNIMIGESEIAWQMKHSYSKEFLALDKQKSASSKKLSKFV